MGTKEIKAIVTPTIKALKEFHIKSQQTSITQEVTNQRLVIESKASVAIENPKRNG